MAVTDCQFPSGYAKCRASLYLPATPGKSKLPCVVLGHGFGGIRALLTPYAKAFSAQGWAVLSFDYRNFGDSDGTERQVLRVNQQLDDWRSAIAYVRSLEQIDPERIALWGSSLGGGHVLSIAAEDHRLRAIVAQAPHISGLAAFRALGINQALRILPSVLADLFSSWFLRRRSYLSLLGDPGATAIMVGDDSKAFLKNCEILAPQIRLDVAAASVLSIAAYFPLRKMGAVTCPVFMLIANKDGTAPAQDALSAAKRVKKIEIAHFDCGHFDIYVEPVLSPALDKQVKFLQRYI